MTSPYKPEVSTTLISKEEILQILEKYNIGRKPLSILLGWGQTTILRYLNGISPTPEYSKELFHILRDPSYYLDVLDAHRERITELAYRKSRQAVQQLLVGSRLSLIAQYIINRASGDISALRVQAILYYSQCFSLALCDRALFEDECSLHASAFIPYPNIYNNMREHGCRMLEISTDMIPDEDLALIDQIYNSLEWYGPEAIRIVTSFERPALQMKLRRNKKKSMDSDIIGNISESMLKSYFSTILAGYNITKPREINSYFNKRSAEFRRRKRTTSAGNISQNH